jgi:hypothetical protein
VIDLSEEVELSNARFDEAAAKLLLSVPDSPAIRHCLSNIEGHILASC